MHFKTSIILGTTIAQVHASTSSCDMHAYCRANVGPLSYCKNWLSVSSCQGGDQVKNCSTCGGATAGTVVTTAAPTTTSTTRVTTTTTRSTTILATTTSTSQTTTSVVQSTTGSCDMHAYCRANVGPLSYCKNWLAVSSCQGGDQVKNCTTCGGTSVTTATPTSTSSKASTTVATTVTTTTSAASTTRAQTTASSSTTTRAQTTASSTTAASCDMHAYCRANVGPLSYCKNWLAVSSCQGGDQVKNCVTCGVSSSNSTTTSAPATTVSSTTSTTTTRATTMNSTTTFVGSLATSATPSTTIPSTSAAVSGPSSSGAECEFMPSYEAPMFLWVELPNIRARSDYVVFYQKLKTFLDKNCVNIRVTTLVVRTISPYFPSTDPMYWPPETSPLFTELIAKLNSSKNPVKVVLYPYVMEDGDRNNWVKFANSLNIVPVNGTMSVYDGVFAFTKMWQDFVSTRTDAATIDGFMIDYEEIYKAIGTQNAITLTPESFGPYRNAYPTIKTGTSIGYDDGKHIRYFDPIMDYIHLQVYDFYYPYASADKSMTDSLFEVYKDDPQGFVNTVLKNVLTSTVLKAYQGRESKVKLMWSTQNLWNNCIYPMRDGRCGVNYEFNWSPAKFNEFVQIVQSNPLLGRFEHGIYTYNFIRPDWVVKSSRA